MTVDLSWRSSRKRKRAAHYSPEEKKTTMQQQHYCYECCQRLHHHYVMVVIVVMQRIVVGICHCASIDFVLRPRHAAVIVASPLRGVQYLAKLAYRRRWNESRSMQYFRQEVVEFFLLLPLLYCYHYSVIVVVVQLAVGQRG